MRRVLIVAAAACTLGAGVVVVAAAAGVGTRSEPRKPAITVTPSAAVVTLASPSAQPVRVSSRTPAGVGSRIATDQTGRAEIEYADGSLARLDNGTEAVIVSLADPADPRRGTHLGLQVGRVWERVQRVGQGDTHAVDTPVAIAAVRGTEYSVTCTAEPSCTYLVVRGGVEITRAGAAAIPLVEGQRVAVDRAGSGPVETLTAEQLAADPWVTSNLAPDNAVTGRPPSPTPDPRAPGAAPTALDVATADHSGTFRVALDFIEAVDIFGEQPGGHRDLTYDAVEDCTSVPCVVRVHIVETGLDLTLTANETGYAGTAAKTTACFDTTGAVLSEQGATDTVSLAVRASDATLVDNRWVVTRFAGSAREALEPTAAGLAAGCKPGRSSASIVGQRQ